VIARNELVCYQQMQKDFLPDRLPQLPGDGIYGILHLLNKRIYDAFTLLHAIVWWVGRCLRQRRWFGTACTVPQSDSVLPVKLIHGFSEPPTQRTRSVPSSSPRPASSNHLLRLMLMAVAGLTITFLVLVMFNRFMTCFTGEKTLSEENAGSVFLRTYRRAGRYVKLDEVWIDMICFASAKLKKLRIYSKKVWYFCKLF